MGYNGGDILEVTYTHDTVGQGSLFVKADEDSTFHRGGFRSADDEAGITADGQFIDTLTRYRPKVELNVMWDMTANDEQLKLQQMQESPILGDWTVQHVSGAIFAGKGKPVGELPGDGKASNIALNLQFAGRLAKIS